uniref:Neuropeptides B and W receptor 1 n=1 Tax=Sphenodon punctatus TaxID=8508 RepID=A0A8D0LAZ6_SPHPU
MENFSSQLESNISCGDAVARCHGREDPWYNMSSSHFIPNFYVAVPIIYSVICAVGLTGNTAVIYVILKAPKMKTVTNIFILNLAIADELFTLVLPINVADYLLLQWPFGEFMCKLIISIDQYNTFSSIYFLTIMSIDRYLVVVATVKSKKIFYRTYRVAKLVSLCVWSFVTVIILPFSIFAKIHVEQGRSQCVFVFPSPESFWWKVSRIYTLILGFAIPVSTICILYTTMLYKLRHMHLHSNAKALDKAKKKVTLMVLIILAVCLFCWTPYHLSTVVALTTDIPQTPLVIGISYFITSLSYANSCLNPFLYAFLDDNFRKSFRKLVECGTSP